MKNGGNSHYLRSILNKVGAEPTPARKAGYAASDG
jgi:hypothetical protein